MSRLQPTAHGSIGCTTLAFVMTMGVSLLAFASAPLHAQHPVRPLPRNGPCPLGYVGSGDYWLRARQQSLHAGRDRKDRQRLPAWLLRLGQLLPQQPLQPARGDPEAGQQLPARLDRLRQLLPEEPLSPYGMWLLQPSSTSLP